jgi:hypothetical protein
MSGCATINQSYAEIPERSIPWPSPVKKLLDVGTNYDYMWAKAANPENFQVWQWSENTIIKRHEVNLSEKTYSLLILPHDKWLSHDQAGFCTGDLNSKKIIHRWPAPKELAVSLRQASRNGKYYAINANKKKDDHWDCDSLCFGLISPDDKTFQWVADLTPEYGDNSYSVIAKVIPSDDGKFIGVVGWNCGFAMIDVSNKKVLWTASRNHEPSVWNANNKNKVPWKQIPLDTVSPQDIAFTPDGKMAYAGGAISCDTGGAAGCIWGIKVETGEIVNKWGTSAPKREEYCRDITTVSVSPDGRFVAAGSVPTGLVFLYSTKDGKRRIIKHSESGTIDFVSFSPDSKRLATYAGYPPPCEIKIWKLPEEEKSSSSPSSSSSKISSSGK